MNAHYPSDYPDGFEEKLIAAGAKTQTIIPVYRILYDGKLNAFNFESTYINYRRRHKTLTKGSYSTWGHIRLPALRNSMTLHIQFNIQ